MIIFSPIRPTDLAQTLPCRLCATVAFITALFIGAPLAYPSQTTLAWNRSSDSEVAGYRLYYGNSSRQYLYPIDVQGGTSWTVADIVEGIPYYFAVTACDHAGNESGFSDEVSLTVYEDAEDISTAGWDICPDAINQVGSITNLFDSGRQTNVITLRSVGPPSCFRLRTASFTDWNNSTQFVLAWSHKSSAVFRVAVVVETSTRTLELSYSPLDYDRLAMSGYVDFGIGSGSKDGRWHSFARNLQTDLSTAMPGVVLQKVKCFRVYGSAVSVADVKLMDSP